MSTDTFRGYDLYPFQQQAIASIRAGRSVIVAAPTGAGKTLVADFAIEQALGAGERIVYTSPVKALSNQKYRDFRESHGDAVGIKTGDVTINPQAPLLIMTTEVFRNTIFEDPDQLAGIRYTIFDEIHYLDDLERGTVWEESIIFAPEAVRFVGLSATVPNVRELADWMLEIRGTEVDVVESHDRPVPLRHFLTAADGKLVPIKEAGKLRVKKRGRRGRPDEGRALLDRLQDRDLLPCLYFCFSRKNCEKLARAHGRRELLTGSESERILKLFDDLAQRYELKDDAGTARLRQAASRGCMHHHAGLLPIYKEIVERLFTSGLVKLLFTTETFALGVNMPARTVIFDMLKKYDGISFGWLRTRDYYQMAGRAGRQGIDTVGHVISRLDPSYDDPFDAARLIQNKIEPVFSRFNLSYSGLLSLYRRLGGEQGLKQAYDRSFAKFQRNRAEARKKGKKGKPGKRGSRQPREARLIDQRLRVLNRAGYIKGAGLTEKGRFAELLNGYEVQAAELFSFGIFHLADELQLAILMTAIIFEERKGDDSTHLHPNFLAEIQPLTERKIREFRELEAGQGLLDLVKEPDFRIAAPTRAWAEGEPLVKIRELTSISDGDLVRNWRMAIQLMRHVRGQVKGDRDLPEKFTNAIAMLNRDEVDARRQLELG